MLGCRFDYTLDSKSQLCACFALHGSAEVAAKREPLGSQPLFLSVRDDGTHRCEGMVVLNMDIFRSWGGDGRMNGL